MAPISDDSTASADVQPTLLEIREYLGLGCRD